MNKQELITSIFQNIDAIEIDDIKKIFENETYNKSYSFEASSDELINELQKIQLFESSNQQGKLVNLSFFALHEMNTQLSAFVTHQNNFISNSQNQTHSQNFFNSFKSLITAIDRYGLEILSNSRMPSFNLREKQLKDIEDLLKSIKEVYDENNISEKLEKLKKLELSITSINEQDLNELIESVSSFKDKKIEIDKFHSDIKNIEQEINDYKEETEENITKNETNFNEYLTQLEELISEKNKKLEEDRTEYVNDKNSLIDDLKDIQKEAKKTLKWATSSALSSSFQSKVNRARFEVWGYFFGVLISSSFMIIFGYLMFFAPDLLSDLIAKYFEISVTKFDSKIDPIMFFILKTITMVPFVLIVSFFWTAYRKAKELFEEYDYKTILAQSLMTHFTYLKENSVLEDDEIKEHTIFVSLKRLLENPVELVYKRTIDEKDFFEKNKDLLVKTIEETIKKVKP
jgi:hypothetical protein